MYDLGRADAARRGAARRGRRAGAAALRGGARTRRRRRARAARRRREPAFGRRARNAAARRGPLALVEALIEGGAFEWQTDRKGRTPLDVARSGRARERAAIVAVLDPYAIADPSFRAAADAIHAGDVAALAAQLDAEPRLLRERIVGPEVYRRVRRRAYFTDPKLFWFVANNPTLVERMPPNIADVAQAMIDRGVDQDDLDYALGLTMSGSAAREQGVQVPLMRVLLAAGARPTRDVVLSAAGHRELDALRALLAAGEPMSVPIAAALGADDALRDLLPGASAEDVQTAFGLAAINGHAEAMRLALDAGADVDAHLPVHAHMTALHQAAQDDDAETIALLLARGARTDQRDTLWDSTPLGWATHFDRANARAALEKADSQRS